MSAERIDYGLMHPTWTAPDCWGKPTEAAAWEAIAKVYVSKGSTGHYVIRRSLTAIYRPTPTPTEEDQHE